MTPCVLMSARLLISIKSVALVRFDVERGMTSIKVSVGAASCSCRWCEAANRLANAVHVPLRSLICSLWVRVVR